MPRSRAARIAAGTPTFCAMEGFGPSTLLLNRDDYEAERAEIYLEVSERWGWSPSVAEHYLNEVMRYDLSDPMLEGFREFQKRLIANGFSDCAHFPELIDPALEPAAGTSG